MDKGKRCALWILLYCLLGAFCYASPAGADQQGLSLGYGFGALNKNGEWGRLRGSNGYYDFMVLTYQYEKHLVNKLNLLLEPFVSVVNRPENGVEGGLGVSARYYFGDKNHEGLFFTAGTGAAYTSVAFDEQGTHGLFILQGGIGYKWKNLFVENRFRHYSNGGLSSPNRSVNANIVSVGWFF